MRVAIEIGAAIVAMREGSPAIFAAGNELPSTAFDPAVHRTFEQALRNRARKSTGLDLAYVEQLYTFGDRGRHSLDADRDETHVVSVGYLALARAETAAGDDWRDWYALFPWEDWRDGPSPLVERSIRPALRRWAEGGPAERQSRIDLMFPSDPRDFDEERTLDRYELLYEAGLVEEAERDGRVSSAAVLAGRALDHDHRRIVATAITRLRAKLKYRPVIFELVPVEFTLTELQHAAEAIAGRKLHKQNFRRLVENADLVEPTGATSSGTGGRPAALFRFRREVVERRPTAGLRLGRR